MSRFPCSACDDRIMGKAAYVYPSIYIGDDQLGERQRLCARCADELLKSLRSEITNDLARGCCWKRHSGQGEPQAAAYAYVTVYDPKSEREDFGGPVCDKCLGLAAATMLTDCSGRG